MPTNPPSSPLNADTGRVHGEVANTQAPETADLSTAAQEMLIMRGLLHDIRNTLAAATGFVEIVTHLGNLNEQQMQMVGRAMRALERTDLRVANALDVAHTLPHGDGVRRHLTIPESVALAPLIYRALEDMQEVMEQKHLSIRGEISEAAVVMGNEHQIAQIATNLIGNAVKYNREGGSVQVDVEQQDGVVVLRVADTGYGIRAEDLDRIFDLSFRGVIRDEQGRRIPVGGTGIGLWLVKTWVELHHGTVQVSSRVGEGTVFTIVLPGGSLANGVEGKAPVLPAEADARRPLRRVLAESVDTAELPKHEQADAVEDSAQESTHHPDSDAGDPLPPRR